MWLALAKEIWVKVIIFTFRWEILEAAIPLPLPWRLWSSHGKIGLCPPGSPVSRTPELTSFEHAAKVSNFFCCVMSLDFGSCWLPQYNLAYSNCYRKNLYWVPHRGAPGSQNPQDVWIYSGREIYFKELGTMIMKKGKSQMCRIGQRLKTQESQLCSSSPKAIFWQNSFLLIRGHFCLLRP